jgi:hypothetical protein
VGSHDDVSNAAAGVLALVLATNSLGRLGLVELLMKKALGVAAGVLDAFGVRRRDQDAHVVASAPSAPVQTRVDGYEAAKKANDPCANCKSTATIPMSAGIGRQILHCNNCGADNGVLASASIGCEPWCPGFVKQFAGGRIKCGNCGRYHTPAPVVMGMTKEQYNLRRNRYRI